MPKLTAAEIKAALATAPAWAKRGAVLRRTYKFADFVAAMKFVNAVARAAERAAHHPDITINWNRVTLALTTHDAGGLTEKDFALAAKCDRLAA
jgi:4a-hydroxytetrahydrobiopterin dehydratase